MKLEYNFTEWTQFEKNVNYFNLSRLFNLIYLKWFIKFIGYNSINFKNEFFDLTDQIEFNLKMNWI